MAFTLAVSCLLTDSQFYLRMLFFTFFFVICEVSTLSPNADLSGVLMISSHSPNKRYCLAILQNSGVLCQIIFFIVKKKKKTKLSN